MESSFSAQIGKSTLGIASAMRAVSQGRSAAVAQPDGKTREHIRAQPAILRKTRVDAISDTAP
jgi:hypothetical protein